MNTSSSTYGPAYSPVLDGERIQTQMEVIRDYMLTAGWKTLAEIEQKLGYPQASVSSQLRHLKKDWAGNYQLDKRRRCEGTWEYFLSPPLPKGQMKLL